MTTEADGILPPLSNVLANTFVYMIESKHPDEHLIEPYTEILLSHEIDNVPTVPDAFLNPDTDGFVDPNTIFAAGSFLLSIYNKYKDVETATDEKAYLQKLGTWMNQVIGQLKGISKQLDKVMEELADLRVHIDDKFLKDNQEDLRTELLRHLQLYNDLLPNFIRDGVPDDDDGQHPNRSSRRLAETSFYWIGVSANGYMDGGPAAFAPLGVSLFAEVSLIRALRMGNNVMCARLKRYREHLKDSRKNIKKALGEWNKREAETSKIIKNEIKPILNGKKKIDFRRLSYPAGRGGNQSMCIYVTYPLFVTLKGKLNPYKLKVAIWGPHPGERIRHLEEWSPRVKCGSMREKRDTTHHWQSWAGEYEKRISKRWKRAVAKNEQAKEAQSYLSKTLKIIDQVDQAAKELEERYCP